MMLFKETNDKKYYVQALHNANVLVANMREGDSTKSPWSFRADYRTGEGRGQVSGDMVYILKLFDIIKIVPICRISFGFNLSHT